MKRIIKQQRVSAVAILKTSINGTRLPALDSLLARSASSTATPKNSTQPLPAPGDNMNMQLLQRSIVPTMHFQRSLPRLPIPKLEKTLERYLKAQKPLLTNDVFQQTSKIVADFQTKDAPELHQTLLARDRAQKHTSYISEWWFDMYLRSRVPLVLNFNPFIAMNDDPVKEKMQQAVRAADLTFSALRFRNSLQAGLLEPDVYHMDPKKSDNQKFRKVMSMLPQMVSWYGAYLYKAFPLDMSQYIRLYNSTRIPRQDKDELYTDNNAKHIAVLFKGTFFAFDVYDSSGNILPAAEIRKCLEHILRTSHHNRQDSIAVLSAAERNNWAQLRQQMVNDGNEAMLRKVDSALFVLSLDEDGIQDVKQYCKSMLHGNGLNRWFDKSFSMIVDKAGRAAVNFEHAWGDGVAVLRFVNEVHKDAGNNNFTLSSTGSGSFDPTSHVERLDFGISGQVRVEVDRVMKEFHKKVDSLDLSILEYPGFGKEEIKKFKFYPDGIMQLAFQTAYYRLNGGKTTATYESCSTAAFKHGRTECIRSATNLTKEFSEKICGPSAKQNQASTPELRSLLKACCDYHGQLTKEAAMGQGFDRHLFALRKIAEESGRSLPIFQDPSYAAINHNILSTSTLQSPAIAVGGFAPVVDDGFGVGYSSMDHSMGVVAFHYPSRNGHDFVEAVRASFDDMLAIIQDSATRVDGERKAEKTEASAKRPLDAPQKIPPSQAA
ncbi:hypothetical protein RvY_14218 [Ramazzottius varieornatus]|uniref:Choline/carnitine acyltransferase domain-containing protein n=1 Tax=Ramazzottius varieornatus TaxID=947166 RepID=A0A1D1VUF6_RAMVA|nr:hypothetical protein RvY_14218 [Ramazzottius varieornatus]